MSPIPPTCRQSPSDRKDCPLVRKRCPHSDTAWPAAEAFEASLAFAQERSALYDQALSSDALIRLAQLSPRLAQVVECRFFAGYGDADTARALGLTDRTVRRDWIKARAWLRRELAESVTGGDLEV